MAFQLMGLAEDLILAYQDTYPVHATLLHQAFPLLVPTNPLLGKADALYLVHAGEILDRLLIGEATEPATCAELLGAFCDLSQKLPLSPAQTVACHRVVTALSPYWPEAATLLNGWDVPTFSVSSEEVEAVLISLGRGLRQSDRALPEHSGYRNQVPLSA